MSDEVTVSRDFGEGKACRKVSSSFWRDCFCLAYGVDKGELLESGQLDVNCF